MFDLLGYVIVACVAWMIPRPLWAKIATDWAIAKGKALLTKNNAA